ncbi:DNA ligase 4 [Armadillidium nasatum]|uniref:DNA ligase 4 n=1 Tax=Armadillidium nasatum TaxID=96803 RepID=A0A5N5T065_9CRUS|nr:DNA ligase 4 [Armadillidium nasatum]
MKNRDRGAYGIKEHRLASLYIRIFGLRKESVDGQKLLNYRKPKSGGIGGGDFADIAYYVLKNRCPDKGELTLADVDSNLAVIAESNAAKNQDVVENSLRQMICKMTASEQKWLIRVLLKDMHLGIGQTTIFNCWHPDAKDFYDVNNSLSKVCTTLRDPSVRLHEIEISLFSPFRPMLADRVVLDKVESQMKHKTFFVEVKYDGERSQIHKKGNQYKYFSRNGFDFSSNFGTSPLNGLFTPHLHPLFAPHVNEIILDGEMVGWSQKYKTIVSKGEQIDVKNLKESGDWQVCFCAFDILYLNGKVLTNLPLTQRLEELQKVISSQEGRVLITSHKEVTSKVVIALNDAIDNREEGLILKDPSSVYQPASRRAGWIKVKPEYVDNCVPDLDLLIIGGYYGTGRRRGVIKVESRNLFNLLVGLALVTQFQSSKILIAKLSKYESPNKPNIVVVGREKPDIWYKPEKSCVLEVKGAEIVKSDLYKTGYTLRFPRVEKIRSDKSWFDILTTNELQELATESSGKFASKHFINESSESPKKKLTKRSHQPSLPDIFRPADVSNIVKKANLFAGKEFCIVTGAEGYTKQDVQTFCIISDVMSVRVQNFIKKGTYNIVRPSWLLDCISESRILIWNPVQIHFLLPEDSRKMEEEYDEFGDSYFSPITAQKLKYVMGQMKNEESWEDVQLDCDTEAEIAFHFKINENCDLFRGVIAFFTDDGETENEILIVPKLKLRMFGGRCQLFYNKRNYSHRHINLKCGYSKLLNLYSNVFHIRRKCEIILRQTFLIYLLLFTQMKKNRGKNIYMNEIGAQSEEYIQNCFEKRLRTHYN